MNIGWNYKTRVLGQFHPGQLPPEQLPPGKLSPENSHLGQLPTRQFSPRTITPEQFPSWTIGFLRAITSWAISQDDSPLGLLPCSRIITSRQLLPRAMTITNYNFFMATFCFFFIA